MRLITLLLLASFLAFAFLVHQGFAQDEPAAPKKGVEHIMKDIGKEILGPPDTDPRQPYMNDATTPHNNQWDSENWHPEYWVEDKGSVTAVMDGFYDAGIIVEQYEDEVPVLEVGKPFLQLSPMDRRHVVEFVDYAFKITEQKPHGIFYIVIDHKKKGKELLGIYTINGLQFQ